MEVSFWNKYISNKGGICWPDDYQERINGCSPLREPHSEIVGMLQRTFIRILDVGSGPITRLGYKLNDIEIEIVACDPNANAYNDALRQHNIDPPVKTVYATGEHLTDVIYGKFDYITCLNALDHTERPLACVHEMLKLVSDDGVIYLSHAINEGLNEGYRGYHKWNIEKVTHDSFRLWNPDSSIFVSEHEIGICCRVWTCNGEINIILTKNNAVLDWANKAMQRIT